MREAAAYRVCDICTAEPARRHRIVLNGKAVEIDLCEAHAEPLEVIFERLALASPKAPGYSTSPHRCTLCGAVLSRRVHALNHVKAKHGYSKEAASEHIRPLGTRAAQLPGPSGRPHRCKLCKKPYANQSTARRHVSEQHLKSIRPGHSPADYVTVIEEDSDDA